MGQCLNCMKETSNPKFCSRSCSTSFSNRQNPKRSLEGKCKVCLIAIASNVTYCKECFANTFSAKDMTLQEAIYTKLHKSSAFALVRARARANVKHLPQICSVCGYSKHVEVCHIKPISDFDLTTLLSEINKLDNLKLLCPNCHWELDHKL